MESRLIVAVLIRQGAELPLRKKKKKEFWALRMDYLAGEQLEPC